LPISYAFAFNNDIRTSDLNATQIVLSQAYKNQIKEFLEPILNTHKVKD
jgi:hypothetical protein